ncbi:MAG: hypothetical protein GX061_08270 [Eubacteriaceae bacterium]|nr:hypothetical protein [Eubacteriaceae bacterium]
MKLKIKSDIAVGDDKLILLGALGIMLLNGLPSVNGQSDESQVYEVDGEGNLLASPPKKTDYITKARMIISANDYAPIKTLYKLQSVLDDISAVSAIDLTASQNSTAGLTDVLADIRPYLSSSKKEKIGALSDNIRKTKKTFDQINSVKGRLSALPPEAPFKDRFKTLLEELPNLTGLPNFDEILNLKNLIADSAIKTGEAAPEGETPDMGAKKEEGQKADYDEIYELMDMLQK